MSHDHAIYKLVSKISPDKIEQLYQPNKILDETCENNRPCRRVRLSEPLYEVSYDKDRLILPLSKLAACDEAIANKTAALLKDKVVILQVTSPPVPTSLEPKSILPGVNTTSVRMYAETGIRTVSS